MRNFSCCLCVAALLAMLTGSDVRAQFADDQTGKEVTVETVSGKVITGELMAVRKDGFVVRRVLDESPVFKWAEVRTISGGANTHSFWWGMAGFVAGGVAGYVLGQPDIVDVPAYNGTYLSLPGYSYEAKPDNRMEYAAILGGGGALVLGLGTLIFDTHFEYELQTMTAAEFSEAKQYLNEKSHYPNADEKTFALAAGLSAPAKTTAVKNAMVEAPKPAVLADDDLADVDQDIPNTSAQRPDAVAVVIGNTTYRKTSVPAVEFASQDARVMKEYLMKMFGYREGNIIFEENATQADFNSIFGTKENYKGKLYNYVKPGRSDVFVYYSGHGAPDPESKQGYFVPVDCDPAMVALNGYSLKTFYDNLSKVRYKSLTVAIDACFSGSSERGMIMKNISPVFIEVEDPVLTLKNASVLTSAAGNQVSTWFPEMGHSLFTYYLLKGLRGDADAAGDHKVSLKELKAYLSENVGYMARRLSSREQTPQFFGNPDRFLVELP